MEKSLNFKVSFSIDSKIDFLIEFFTETFAAPATVITNISILKEKG
jgi:hypothetical protein